jgi:hypothetical protein
VFEDEKCSLFVEIWQLLLYEIDGCSLD